ncbi:uncharacterized protein LOC126672421 [Mercurialis annua]|uniref:uncharacterized protein LOC126672421 n=1 Tax=Mercurialis annua TaxID=3986 RepID=UPI00215DEFB6|nr:uncharacterized protein LOC126672421 [Mercurialis annua]
MAEQRTTQARVVAQHVNEAREEVRGNTGEYDPVQSAGRGRGRGIDQEEARVGQVRYVQALGVPQPPNVNVNQLAAELSPKKFDASSDALDFLEEVVQNARGLQADERQTVMLTEMSMKGPAMDWFRQVIRPIMGQITWAEFVIQFKEFFLSLSRGDGSVYDYVAEFNRLSRFSPDLMIYRIVDSARQMERALIHLNEIPDPSRPNKTRSECLNYEHRMSRQVRKETERRHGRTHKKGRQGKAAKRARTISLKSKQGSSSFTNPICPQYSKRHLGVCQAARDVCFKCGQQGHYERECPHLV